MVSVLRFWAFTCPPVYASISLWFAVPVIETLPPVIALALRSDVLIFKEIVDPLSDFRNNDGSETVSFEKTTEPSLASIL